MQHVEFLHTEHFEKYYHRSAPPKQLAHLIDFFWETRFDQLFKQYPDGFSDVLFPNTGYTYLINLGTPFVMQVGEKKFPMKSDGFLPRQKSIECHHKSGNHLFGIKFKISPIVFEKKINFSEYREYIFPLSYLLDAAIIASIKKAPGYNERVNILSSHFISLINRNKKPNVPARIVSSILNEYENGKYTPVEKLAAKHKISSRTLQRYFEMTTSTSSKQVLQILRIRKATEHLVTSPATFNHELYGYFDHSHFYKHLKQFLESSSLKNGNLHRQLLEHIHKKTTRR